MIHTDFTNVTEQPGQKASKEQLSMMMTRYKWGKEAGKGKEILEIACGSGTGLGFLASGARRVHGGDIDPKLVAIAQQSYRDRPEITVGTLDAHETGFDDQQFDTIVFFEAIYYLSDVQKFFREAKRILRPGGKLLISSVNCEWHGFNPSPFSVGYYSAEKLIGLAKEAGFGASVEVGFLDEPSGLGKLISLVRIVAVKLRLIPDTMEGKEKLKRIFFGELQSIPKEITDGLAPVSEMTAFSGQLAIQNFKQLYLTCEI